MRKFAWGLTMIVFFISALSCSKTASPKQKADVLDNPFSAQKNFAQILSKAANESSALRLFIKSKALEQFDKDYDVFYPFVKDSEVEKGKTFRDLLLEFTDENTLSSIEEQLPKLTILVPEWSWMQSFSVKSWDASQEEIAVTYIDQDGSIACFNNGSYIGAMPDGSYPDFPVLIIKNNERITYSPATKGSPVQYSFVDEYFNNVNTKVEHRYTNETVDGTPDISNIVYANEIKFDASKMFDCFHADTNLCYQRDFLYYGMTEEGQNKVRRENVWEQIYKIKFRTYDIDFLYDDVGVREQNNGICDVYYDFDKTNFDRVVNYKQNNSPLTPAEMRNYYYAEGNIELNFLILVPGKDGKVFTTTKPLSLSFGDVFAIDHLNLDYRHRTWFCRDWYVYTLDKKEAIKPKWYKAELDLPRWDISQNSGTITIAVTEFDEIGDSEIEYTARSVIAKNFKIEADATANTDTTTAKIGLGYNYSKTEESNIRVTYKRSQGGIDNLGQAELEYLHPIILEKYNVFSLFTYYKVRTISTGMVDIMMLPRTN